MSKRFIISEEEKKYLMSLYSNKGIIKEQGTTANLPWIDSKGKYQEVNSNQTQGDKGTWTYEKALKKYPCLDNLAKDKQILNNGSYDYIKINWNNKTHYAFLGDGHLFDLMGNRFTEKYLGKDIPCIATPTTDANTWDYKKAVQKYPCLNNLAKDQTISNNGSYDYIKINWNNKEYNLFLGDGHLFDLADNKFTEKYLGKDVPCKGESINNKLDSQASKANPSSNRYIDQLAKQLQLPGKSEQEKINQIMAELNKITPKTATT